MRRSVYYLLLLTCMLNLFVGSSLNDEVYDNITLLINNQKIKEAKNIVQGLLEKNEKNIEAHYFYGIILSIEGKLDDALEETNKCISYLKSDAAIHLNKKTELKGNVYYLKGSILEIQKKYEKALACYEEDATHILSCDKDFIRSKFICCYHLKMCDKLILLYKDYLKRFGEKDSLLSMLTICLEEANRTADALYFWRELIERNPDRYEYHEELANLSFSWGMYKESWFEARIAYTLTGNTQIKSMIEGDLPSVYPEPKQNMQRVCQYLKKLKKSK